MSELSDERMSGKLASKTATHLEAHKAIRLPNEVEFRTKMSLVKVNTDGILAETCQIVGVCRNIMFSFSSIYSKVQSQ